MTKTIHLANARDVIAVESQGLQALVDHLADTSDGPLAQAFVATVDLIKDLRGRVIVTGMGKSGHIARKIVATLASTGTPAMYVHPGEASHGDLGMIGQQDLVLGLSNSGETPELGDIIAYCGRFNIPLIAMTSGAASSLAKGADHVLLLPPAIEACGETRAPTTSTTMSLALGDALAVALLRDKGFSASDFRNYHPGGKLGAAFKQVRHMMHDHKELPLVAADMTISAAVKIMSGAGFGCVGVVDGQGLLIGMVTDGDLRRNFDPSLPDQLVSGIMTKAPMTVQPDTMAAEALGMLSEKRITALFVVEHGKPIGLLHVHDCLSTGVI